MIPLSPKKILELLAERIADLFIIMGLITLLGYLIEKLGW